MTDLVKNNQGLLLPARMSGSALAIAGDCVKAEQRLQRAKSRFEDSRDKLDAAEEKGDASPELRLRVAEDRLAHSSAEVELIKARNADPSLNAQSVGRTPEKNEAPLCEAKVAMWREEVKLPDIKIAVATDSGKRSRALRQLKMALGMRRDCCAWRSVIWRSSDSSIRR